jgi:hypothetical protein
MSVRIQDSPLTWQHVCAAYELPLVLVALSFLLTLMWRRARVQLGRSIAPMRPPTTSAWVTRAPGHATISDVSFPVVRQLRAVNHPLDIRLTTVHSMIRTRRSLAVSADEQHQPYDTLFCIGAPTPLVCAAPSSRACP